MEPIKRFSIICFRIVSILVISIKFDLGIITKLSSPRRYAASALFASAALVRSCIAFCRFSALISFGDASGSSCDDARKNDNDLRKSSNLESNRMKMDDDAESEELYELDMEDRICNASSTRNCAIN